MSIDNILNRLDRVKETGNSKYLACCPAHDDRSPSLSIRETKDDQILLNCFAGCDPQSVLDALGLTFSDLYPEPLGHHFKPTKQRVNAREILASLDHESLVVAIIGADFINRKSLDDETWERLVTAVNRINSARAQAAPLQFKQWCGSRQPASKTAQRKEAA